MTGGGRPGSGGAAHARLDGLDQLRFTAAFAVLLYHYVSSYAPRLDAPPSALLTFLSHGTRYGYLGVHLFFMISGFVILWSSIGRSATDFAIGRFARLYPSFWAALALAVLLLWALGTFDEASVVTWPHVAANATMMPTMLGSPRIDDVYWTLELELRFYALVFVLLVARQMRHVETWIAVWLATMVGQMAIGGRLLSLLTLAPYGAFFVAGTQFCLIRHSGRTPRRLIVLGVASLLCLHQAWAGRHEFVTPDPVSAVMAPLVVAVGLALLWRLATADVTERAPSPLAARLGELTYPLYLTHATLGVVVLRNFPEGTPAGLRVAATALLAFVVAALFAWVEPPLRVWLTRRLKDRTAGWTWSPPGAARPTS